VPIGLPSPARAEPHDATAWLPLPDFAELPPLEQLLLPDPTVEPTPARDLPVGLPSPARAEPHDATAWLPLPDLEELPSVDALLVPDPTIEQMPPRDVPIGLPSPARAEPHDAAAWLPLPELEPDPSAGGDARPPRSHRRTGRVRIPFRALATILAVTATVAGAYFGVTRLLDQGDDVDVRVDGRVISTETGVSTVGALLAEQKVTLGAHDRTVPVVATPITNKMTVKVLRAYPVTVDFDGTTVTVETTHTDVDGFVADAAAQLSPTAAVGLLNPPKRVGASDTPVVRTIKTGALIVDGRTLTYSSPAHTVSELLANLDVKLDDADVTSPYAVTDVLPDKTQISIVRVRNETKTVNEEYTLPDERQPDPTVSVLAPERVVEGTVGLQAVTYQIIRHNRVVNAQIPINFQPITPATPRITYYGTIYDPRWDKIAECETGLGPDGLPGNWSRMKDTYQGGLGIWYGNWLAYRDKGWPKNAGNATKYQQIIVAERIKADYGFKAWGCGKTLGFARDDGRRQF
jgi:uncharacterized protein YabE (DUF348 family)